MSTSPPKSRRFLYGSLSAIAVAILGYGAWCFVRLHELRSDAHALLARTKTVGRPAEIDPSAADLHAEIAEIDRWLEEHAPASDGIATPAHWDEEPEVIDATIDRLEDFFVRVDDLLVRPDATAWLQKQGARSPTTTGLASTRNWTNLLCLRALRAARRSQWDEAGTCIAQALALVRLREDGTMLATSVRVSSEGIALAALRRIATMPDADVALLRRAVEPELRRAVEPAPVVAAISAEVRRWLEEGRTIPNEWSSAFAWLARPYHIEWARRELDAYGEVVDEALRQLAGRASGTLDLDGHLVTEHTTIENEAFAIRTSLEISLLARSRAQIARTAIALLEHHEMHGRWPTALAELAFSVNPPRDPCRDDPFPYAVTANGADLGPAHFAAVRGFDRAQATQLLLDWTLVPSMP